MLYAEDFRRIARESLKGKWVVAVGTGFVASLLGTSITGTRRELFLSNRNNDSTSQHIHQWFQTDLGRKVFPWFVGLMVIIIILVLVRIVIAGPITLGYTKFNLNLVEQKETQFVDVFSQFHRIGAGFCMWFLRGVYILLWTLLLIIPGIIAMYSYAMTPYIMVEHPEYGVNEAIGYSKELMRGNRWRLFCMQISFIGWAILCVFSLGIGFLWLIPYQEAANAAFYCGISRKRFNGKTTGM